MAVIVIDFDGVIVENNYPEIGTIKPHAKRVINNLINNEHEIIINTCRAGIYEGNVYEFLQKEGIKYTYINSNLPRLIEKFKQDCRKISGDVYIDDKNLGRPIIDWLEIEKELKLFHNII